MELDDIIELIRRSAESTGKFDSLRGTIIGTWACIESAIDRSNHYGWWYTERGVADKIPVSLGRKVKLFEEINRDLLPFESLRGTGAQLLARVNSLFDDRHWMAHGYLLVEKSGEDHWVVQKHDFPRDTGGLLTVERTFTLEELHTLRGDLMHLALDFSGYLRAMAQQVDKHPREDRGR